MALQIRFATDADLPLVRSVEHRRFVLEDNEMTEEEFQRVRPVHYYSLVQSFIFLVFAEGDGKAELAVMLGGREPNNAYFEKAHGHWLHEPGRRLGGEICYSYTDKRFRKVGLQLLVANIAHLVLWAKGSRLSVSKMRFKPHWKKFGPHFTLKIGAPEVVGPAKNLYQNMLADMKEQFVCSACVMVKEFHRQGLVRLAEICREKATKEAVHDVIRLLRGVGETAGVEEFTGILEEYYDVDLWKKEPEPPAIKLKFSETTVKELEATLSAAEQVTFVVLPSWL